MVDGIDRDQQKGNILEAQASYQGDVETYRLHASYKKQMGTIFIEKQIS